MSQAEVFRRGVDPGLDRAERAGLEEEGSRHAGVWAEALVVHEVVEVGVQPVEDVVLLGLRELAGLHRAIQVRLHGILDRRLQTVDRLVLIARDVGQRLAGLQLCEQLLIGQSEVLGGSVESALGRAERARPEEDIPAHGRPCPKERRPAARLDLLLDLVGLRLCEPPGLYRGVEPVRERPVDRVVELLGGDIEPLGHIAEKRLPGVVVRLGDGVRRASTSQHDEPRRADGQLPPHTALHNHSLVGTLSGHLIRRRLIACKTK